MPSSIATFRAALLGSITLGCFSLGVPPIPRTPLDSQLHPEMSIDADVSLEGAVVAAVRASSELEAGRLDVLMREADAHRAALSPNPELSIELENFGGSGLYEGTDAAEATVLLSQPVEVGSKRRRRTQVALLERDLAASDHRIARAILESRVAKAGTRALVAQERVMLAESLATRAEEVTTRLADSSGKMARIDLARAEVVRAQSLADLETARGELRVARSTLAALLGTDEDSVPRVSGSFNEIPEPAPIEVLLELMDGRGQIERWDLEVDLRQAELRLERARRIPTVTLSAGYRRFSEGDDDAAIVGLGVPLPVFDRNRAGVARASLALARAKALQSAHRRQLRAHLIGAHSDLEAARARVLAMRRRVVPEAEEAFAQTNRAYRQGRADFLAALDVQRTLFRVRNDHLEALASYHEARFELERLLAEGPLGAGESARGLGEGH